MKVNDLIKSAKIRIPAILKSASDIILKPIFAYPGFVAALTLLGAISPLAMLTTGQIFFHFIFYALTQSFAVAYLLAWVAYAVKHRWFRIAVICLVASFAIFEAGQIALTSIPVTEYTVDLTLNTNSRISSDFFHQFLKLSAIAKFCCIVVGIVFSIYVSKSLINKLSKKPRFAIKLPLAMLSFLIFIIGGLSLSCHLSFLKSKNIFEFDSWIQSKSGDGSLTYYGRLIHSDTYSKLAYITKYISLEHKSTQEWLQLQRGINYSSKEKTNQTADCDIIIIIGESFMKSHSSIYGYYLETNPKLYAEIDSGLLIPFNDIITAANYTMTSLINFLNLNEISSHEKWSETVYWPLLFKLAGFNVNFYSNQIIIGTHTSCPDMLYYQPEISNLAYKQTSDTTCQYDGDFVNFAINEYIPRERQSKNLTFWHLYGQHFLTVDRFPKNSYTAKFKDPKIVKNQPWMTDEFRQEVLDYANATIYNDSIVAEIINLYRNKPTFLVYFSDHGETVKDEVNYSTRETRFMDREDCLRAQFDIPFFVWMSRPFREAYPEIVAKVEAAKDRPGMLDNLGQMLLGVAGIQTEYYRSDRDILSDDYVARPRVTEAGYEYDRIVNSD